MPDSSDIVFDDLGTPILAWHENCASFGPGWILYYQHEPESPTAGLDEHFIGGDLASINDALEQARSYLRTVYQAEG